MRSRCRCIAASDSAFCVAQACELCARSCTSAALHARHRCTTAIVDAQLRTSRQESFRITTTWNAAHRYVANAMALPPLQTMALCGTCRCGVHLIALSHGFSLEWSETLGKVAATKITLLSGLLFTPAASVNSFLPKPRAWTAWPALPSCHAGGQ
jgi:hypothetical protein